MTTGGVAKAEELMARKLFFGRSVPLDAAGGERGARFDVLESKSTIIPHETDRVAPEWRSFSLTHDAPSAVRDELLDDDLVSRRAQAAGRRAIGRELDRALRASSLERLYVRARQTLDKAETMVEVKPHELSEEKSVLDRAPDLRLGVDPSEGFHPAIRIGEEVRFTVAPWDGEARLVYETNF